MNMNTEMQTQSKKKKKVVNFIESKHKQLAVSLLVECSEINRFKTDKSNKYVCGYKAIMV